ncbi:dethiobiotin synthetase [Cupriavidus sp. USMAHM13]|uniref:dethiobiotin synthetase n=1 Tax=Cupriavidus sp. USMAHM13 TaxID=1389192 RepID=UPI0009F2D0CD|nr:dethiobiotin synthetase [Cupriavidus sp. USMAHM13]
MKPASLTRSAHAPRPRRAGLWLALCALPLLFACADPAWRTVAPGAGSDALQARLGPPRETYRLPDGSQRWLYPGPSQTKWSASLDPSGHVIRVHPMLSGAEAGEAKVGEWTMQDVLAHYGKPVDTSRFPRMQRQVWSYRFAEDNVSYATMHFYFDPQGVLRLTQVVPDYLLES